METDITLLVSYVVSNASWSSAYDVRALPVTKEMKVGPNSIMNVLGSVVCYTIGKVSCTHIMFVVYYDLHVIWLKFCLHNWCRQYKVKCCLIRNLLSQIVLSIHHPVIQMYLNCTTIAKYLVMFRHLSLF